MVVAQEMEDSVDHQELDLFAEAPPRLARVAVGGIDGDDDVTQVTGARPLSGGKGEDVGGGVDAPVTAVQTPDLAIRGQQDRDLIPAAAQRAEDFAGRFPDELQRQLPASGTAEDVDDPTGRRGSGRRGGIRGARRYGAPSGARRDACAAGL
jgi:hypothetical protein